MTTTTTPPEPPKKKRGKKKAEDQLPCRMYQYGLLPPIENSREVAKQMWAAHLYNNQLRELDRQRRAESDALINCVFPHLLEWEAEWQVLDDEIKRRRQEIKAGRQQARRRTPVDNAERLRIKQLERDRAALRARIKPQRAATWKDHQVRGPLAEIKEKYKALRKAARKHTEAFWGTYLIVENSLKDVGKGAPPKDKKFRGDGHVAVQIQHGISVQQLLGMQDTRVKLEYVSSYGGGQGGKTVRKKMLLWLRVTSTPKGKGGGKPIWAKFPMVLHRPLPEHGRITWVHVLRTRVGTVDRWTVNFAVSSPTGFPPPANLGRLGSSAVGVDIGWRKVPEGLRVAYWVDEHGEHDQLVLPQSLLDLELRTCGLISARKKNFNIMRDRLRDWLSQFRPQPNWQAPADDPHALQPRVNAQGQVLPTWAQVQLQHIGLWKSPNRLWLLVRRWRDRRFAGDEEIMGELGPHQPGLFRGQEFADAPTLLIWWRQDRHLHDWHSHQSRHYQNARQALYRNWVAQMRERYGKVAIETFDLRELSETPPPEDDPSIATVVTQKRLAALSVLVTAIKQGGWSVFPQPAEYTTQKCHRCDHVEEFDAMSELEHTCPNCFATWDQDYNAAYNLLAAMQPPADAGEPVLV